MVSFKSSYHPIDAAILWCGLEDHETEILQIELSQPGCLLKHFPQWPTLHLYAERIYDAIISGELPATYLGGPIALSDKVERAYWSIRHSDLRVWFARNYPHEKPTFLFDKENVHCHCVSLGVYLALKADRDAILRELENSRRITSSPPDGKPAKSRHCGLTAPLDSSEILSETSETVTYIIIGALLTVILGKSTRGQLQSIYKNQAAVVDAIITQFPNIYGLSKRTIDRKFAEARRRFAQAGRA
ncbi:hypothetical protein C1882_04940 [Pseudomonas sp. FW305-E2]|uniref:hypothetical protein n=1 Tax=Pseudomonas sp. FW305-E2 TaxID=2075558 RepID=UPI000B4F0235|nr:MULTISPECIES: hypothetical protein [Pseudomonas]POA87905.1 hypothetical protein C1882_04940 [Pseudomonas sp. FW305-E2]